MLGTKSVRRKMAVSSFRLF